MHLKVCGVAVIIQNFKALLNSFIDDVLKYKAGYNYFKYICITMCSLVMSPFSQNFLTLLRLSYMHTNLYSA